MNLFVMGGGRVGFHLARLLSEEDFEVTVIESEPERQEYLDLHLNAQVVLGDGASVLLLQSLNAGEAGLFVACTGDDDKNLVAAAVAKGLGARQVVARVENLDYIESSLFYEGFLGVDYLLSPDALVAQEIVNYIVNPGVLATEEFAKGRIQLRQVQVSPTAPAANRLLRDILTPGSGVLVGIAERDSRVRVPHGDYQIVPGDKVTLLGKREQMSAAIEAFQGVEPRMQRVAIMGGGAIGQWVAHSLEGKIERVKLFERRLDRAQTLAAGFSDSNIQVIAADATSRESLEQEHLDTFDLFVSTTEDDERNIVAGVLAHEVGVKMSAAVVHHPDFAPLVVRLGIDMAVTPRSAVTNSVLKLLRQQTVIASAILGEGEAEVLEFDVGANCPVFGQPLHRFSVQLPRDAIIATIIRGDDAFVPGGNDTIEPGDAVVIIATANSSDEARRFLQGNNRKRYEPSGSD